MEPIKDHKNEIGDLAAVEISPIQDVLEKSLVLEFEDTSAIDFHQDLRPTREMVRVQTLPQRYISPTANEMETADKLPMPILIFEEEADEKFKLGKFLAKANLLPKGLSDIVGVGFKEKLVPESFQELKETR